MTLYPLLFESIYKEKVWGGRKLEALLGRELPEGLPIGEAWDVADISKVRNGPLAGWTLAELVPRLGGALVGQRVWDRYGEQFPLLLKLIDASDVLSVQVHPDDDYARQHGEPWGKTESWYVFHAEPDSELIHGFNRFMDRDKVEAAIRENDLSRYLHRMVVRAGDVVYVPAGMVHAIGEGVLLYEIQQRSDTTYRLYDWGRVGLDGRPRDLHVGQALEVLDYAPWSEHRAPAVSVPLEAGRSYLVACRHFALELWDVCGDMRSETDGESFNLITVAAGEVVVRYGPDGDEEVRLRYGETALLPAELGWYMLRTVDRCRVLRAYVPDLWVDVVSPLVHAGSSRESIRSLAGYGLQNDLDPLLVSL